MGEYLQRAGVVLCNPPFEKFGDDERDEFDLRSMRKPSELLHRVLDDLHPGGVLGFVLPRAFLDGQEYSSIRNRIAERFGSIELTALPDRPFNVDAETVLLIASDPIPHDVCKVVTQRVADNPEAWSRFERSHEITWTHSKICRPSDCRVGFPYPEIPAVWDFLEYHYPLSNFADVGRGIEWSLPLLDKKRRETGNRELLVRSEPPDDSFAIGIAPRTELSVLQTPLLNYLDMKHQRGNAWERPWSRPKAIFGKSGRSRGPWKIAAFADRQGLVCYQTYTAAWPTTEHYDEVLLAAILNGPIANAFIAVREGKTDVTVENVQKIPMPVFTAEQRDRLHRLVAFYESQIAGNSAAPDASRILMEIDAAVLDGYRMPAKLEREVLEFFRGHELDRRTVHPFGEYMPEGCQFYMSLSRSLAPNFSGISAEELAERGTHR